LAYVAQYASRFLPWHYCLSALWVGQAGSLLLWAYMTGAMALLFRALPTADASLRNTAFGFVMAITWFLIAVMVFAANPMAPNVSLARDGSGLSPLLQHPSMLIHPPIVFLGYAAWTFPCALALAALWLGRFEPSWLHMARPWAVAAWTLLGGGLLLGGHWAYQELGWGGYWGWDPVENGSLMPWLTGTAFIHCTLAWRHRDCLKKSAVLLAMVTFALCNFATFLTRSGIFSSVHAFSESPIGWMFLVLMVGLLAGGVVLVVGNRQLLHGAPLGRSVLARENLIAASAFLLFLLAMVVLAGTLVAPLSMLITGRMSQVGPAFYNNVLPPIALALLAMTAAVPLLQWGAPPRLRERYLLVLSLAVSGIVAALAAASGVRQPLTIGIVGLAALTASASVAAWLNDGWRRHTTSRWHGLWSALRSGRHKYAAYSIHFGIGCVAVGVAASSLGNQRQDFILDEGAVIQWAGRQIRYVELVQSQVPDKLVAEAVLEVADDGGAPVTLRPARHLHLLQNEWTTEVAIDSSWSGDFYAVLHAGLGNGQVSLSFVDNPLIRWIWAGGIWSAASAVASIWPPRARRRMPASQAVDECASETALAVRAA
jgi:cytochrome c-type biogenesis protein CcmF